MKNIFTRKNLFIAGVIGLLLSCGNSFSFAKSNISLDEIRAELACQNDKTSNDYIKLKNKLDKYILQNNVDYSQKNRLMDAVRLIKEKNYNPAIYELKALIDENYNKTKCLELLGDIAIKATSNISKGVKYYKLALKDNPDNISAAY